MSRNESLVERKIVDHRTGHQTDRNNQTISHTNYPPHFFTTSKTPLKKGQGRFQGMLYRNIEETIDYFDSKVKAEKFIN
jgi:hypothetical protein